MGFDTHIRLFQKARTVTNNKTGRIKKMDPSNPMYQVAMDVMKYLVVPHHCDKTTNYTDRVLKERGLDWSVANELGIEYLFTPCDCSFVMAALRYRIDKLSGAE
jgi:hypothetical protein